MPLGKKASSYRGAYRVPLFNYSVCVCQCVCNIRRFYLLREMYEADFHKPGIYGSGRVWANAWDMLRRAQSRVGRGRRAAVDFVVCSGWGGIFSHFFFFERTRPTGRMRPPLASFTSLLVIRQGRERKATEAVFRLYAKKPLHTGVRRGCHYLISHSVRLSVCLSVCVTFVVFTDCESCTRPISTTPASMKAGEYGLTRGTCLVVCRLELDAVAGLLWISWCVLGGADLFSVFFFRFFFLRTHTACCKYAATLPHLPLY